MVVCEYAAKERSVALFASDDADLLPERGGAKDLHVSCGEPCCGRGWERRDLGERNVCRLCDGVVPVGEDGCGRLQFPELDGHRGGAGQASDGIEFPTNIYIIKVSSMRPPRSPSLAPQMTFPLPSKSRAGFLSSQRQAHLSLSFLVIGAGALCFPRSFPPRLTPISPIQVSAVFPARIPSRPPATESGSSRPCPKMHASPTPACACPRTCPKSSPNGAWARS